MVRLLLAAFSLMWLASPSPGQGPEPAEAVAEHVPFEKTVRAYRTGPIAENVQIRVKDDRGRERRSDILVKVDASRDGGRGPLLARIELGDLAVSIDGDRVLATHRLERNRFAEFTLAHGALLETLQAIMPALTLPQLVLADRATDRIDDLGMFANHTPVRWETGVIDRPTGKMMYAGVSGETTFRMLVDRSTGRLSALQVSSPSGAIRNIDLTARAVSPGSLDTWPVEVAGRKRVDSLADLVAESEQVRVGEQFPPTLSLRSTGLAPWKELKDNLASVLVFVPFNADGLDDAEASVRDAAVARLRRETSIANRLVRNLEVGSTNRWIARCVGIIPPDAVRFDITSIVLTVLNSTDSAVLSEPDNMPLIAVGQYFDYDTILGGGQGGAVVLDKARIVRAIITLDDLESTEKKIREVLDTLK